MIGKTLGHYQITEKLGEGGMGIVYKARDTHLDRFVSIKVLPAEKVADPERKRRFVQEAKAASALNHPNIVHVYDIDQSEGTDFIAMEYVDGKTLDQLIPRKGMRLSNTLKYAVQIADALATAHTAGIVHRDLKPANVMVTEKGLVKVLDFGLAKLTERVESDETRTTETLEPHTEEGSIVGTVAYMSPEQAEGKKVDARSDVFSLGSVLYEMVTGQKAFQGTSKMSTLSAILHQEPKPVSGITQAIPSDLEKLVNSGSAKPKPLLFTGGRRPAISLENHRLVYEVMEDEINIWRCQIPKGAEKSGPPSRLIASTQTRHAPQYSPDGEEIAYVSWDSGNPEIWICDSDGSNPLQLTHLGGPEPGSPHWPPNGQQIVFSMTAGKQTAIHLIPAQGGQPEQLTNTPFNEGSPSFSRDSKWIYFASDRSGEGQVWKMPAEAGEQVQVTRKGGGDPQESMDGKSLFYLKGERGYVSELWKVPVDDGEESRVLEAVYGENFDVKGNGIYYAESKYPEEILPEIRARFLFYDFAGEKAKPIATIRKWVGLGFSVSPDEHWILYTEWEGGRANLMLVENFR